ncbi:restriction endonuclease [Nosocomiicoccus sp. HMSC067E10]|uniref:HsdM family class I SAM-dependent methyltransferase n=1 Tax=Nosocomiicoccus sp. HMSC067E10 TaxID=1739271 RepID=UPI0008A404F7|nr:N-6 DNA methylase [Nosocomiicoccus sp. HMSC067E10]OFL47472.1 restriction endonuclease [Nosocomiicoccus sp. HMSC067E10]
MTKYNNETQTDIWVYNLAKEAGITLHPQGSNIESVVKSLKTASKNLKGNVGLPDFTAVVSTNNDAYLIVIENKKETSLHISFDDHELISKTDKDINKYAVNGAVHYAQHLVKDDNVPFKKIFAIGISGNEERHRITPVFIDESPQYKILDDLDTLVNISEKNIVQYYMNEVLEESTETQKKDEDIFNLAKMMHEDLRTYGNLQEKDKPLIVSGILLALRESEYGGFNTSSLTNDKYNPDGYKIFDAIDTNLNRSSIKPQTKKDKLLSQFDLIKNNTHINSFNTELGMTPLKHFTLFLEKNIYKDIKFTNSVHDYIGNFYSEFMSYGGDGQGLGIVLTPAHITDLFCDLVDIKPNDVVFDPCTGTGGFLIASMHKMLEQADKEDAYIQRRIRQEQLHGIELQSYMFTIATTNMILRGDGKSNLLNDNFLSKDPFQIQSQIAPTVGMINPPYSMAKRTKDNNQLEINFISRMLDTLTKGGKGIAIVPQSTAVGVNKDAREIKADILKRHTLEGVITLQNDTFYGVGVNACIMVFTAGIPHEFSHEAKFIDFKDDGYKVAKHIGLIETNEAQDKKEKLLNVWRDELEAPNEFCVKSKVKPEDEWLHSFYYFDDRPPTEDDFKKSVNDYLSFQLDMVLHGREYLFEEGVFDERN